MIFDCYDGLFCENRCEWAIIRHFVEEYNRYTGKSFRAKEFPDLIHRNTPQPEVLLVAEGEKDIVVERTSVVWPVEHFANHKRIHRIAHRLNRDFGPQFVSSPMVLECDEATLPELPKLVAALDQLCSLIAAGTTNGDVPFPWRLRPFALGLDDDEPKTGIGVVVWSPDKWSSPTNVTQGRNDAVEGFAQAYRKALEHACKKFKGSPNNRHMLLVQFLGDGEYIFDEDLGAILRDARMPSLVDEVWAAYRVSQDDEHYQIGWRRLTDSF